MFGGATASVARGIPGRQKDTDKGDLFKIRFVNVECFYETKFQQYCCCFFVFVWFEIISKETACHPAYDFPLAWHITQSPNRWTNNTTQMEYTAKILMPHIRRTN